MKKLNIAFLTSETAPYTNTGGLSDVSEFLIQSLVKKGHKVTVFIPFYKCIDNYLSNPEIKNIKLSFDVKQKVLYYKRKSQFLDYYFIVNNNHFNREFIYGSPGEDYTDNDVRFIYFSKAVCEIIVNYNLDFDIVHCNEWTTSLIPFLVKFNYFNISSKRNIKSVLTVHNLAFQGIFNKECLSHLPFGPEIYNDHCLKHNDKVNFLKAGLLYSDILAVPSSNYKTEICTQINSHGLYNSINTIKNIIHPVQWAPVIPSSDEINKNNTIQIKEFCRERICRQTDLEIRTDIPLIYSFCDFEYQDGLDIIARVIENLITAHKFQFILSCSNKKENLSNLIKLKKHFRKQIFLDTGNKLNKFDIMKAGDIFFSASRSDPSGIRIMNALKSGGIPVVSSVGAASDIVYNIEIDNDYGNGFLFKSLEPLEIISKILLAFSLYEEKDKYRSIQQNNCIFERKWHTVANEYCNIYNSAIKKDIR